jgi:hypothetical protein
MLIEVLFSVSKAVPKKKNDCSQPSGKHREAKKARPHIR